jgi:hypothetical protein
MTQPPVDPAGVGSSGDASLTEPVPAFAPAPAPAPTPAPPFAPAPPTGMPPLAPALQASVPPAFGFAPVEPEPGPGGAYTVPPAAATPSKGRGPGPSRMLTVAVAAAVLVGAVGIAFAAGRATSPATSPASDTTGGVSNRQQQGSGGQGGQGIVPDQGQGIVPDQGGLGPMGGGNLPDASFDLNGNGGFPGDMDGDGDHAFPGRGLGREGFGGLGLAGTVTAVDEDSITIETDAGMTVVVGRDGTTTYHQQAPADASDVTTGSKVQVQLDGGVRPSQDASGNINLGTAGDVTIVP